MKHSTLGVRRSKVNIIRSQNRSQKSLSVRDLENNPTDFNRSWQAHIMVNAPPPLPPHGHIWDLMLVWRKGNIEKTVSILQYCVPYYYNGAQRYEQFLQVGQLYRALILLSLALFQAPLCLRSLWCHICINFFLLTSFSLPFSQLSLVRLALDLVD